MSQHSPSSSDSAASPGADATRAADPDGAQVQGAGAPRRRRRLRRVLVWGSLGLILLIVIVVGATLGTLSRLDHPTVSGWLQDTLAEDYGLGLEYDALSLVVFSGLHAENLRIRTPPPYHVHAPYLLHIGRIDVSWDFWSLVGGEPRIDEVTVERVALSVVVDEHGGSSVLELARGFPPSEEEDEPPPVPLSRLLQESLPALVVEAIAVREVSFELVELENDAMKRRVTMNSLCLGGPFRSEPGVLDTALRLGSCDDGLRLAVTEQPGTDQAREQELVMRLEHTVRAGEQPNRIEVELTGELVRQDLLPDMKLPEQVLRARASVRFDPDAGRTHVRLEELRLLDGVVTTSMVAALDDGPDGAATPSVERLQGKLDASRLTALAPAALSGISMDGAGVEWEVTGVAMDPATGMPARGQVAVRADIDAARVDRDGQDVALDALHASLDASVRDLRHGRVNGELRMDRLDADLGGERVSLQALRASLAGSELAVNLADPAASRGELTVEAGLDRIEAVTADATAAVSGLSMKTEIMAGDTITVRGELPIAQVQLRQGRRGPRVDVRDVSLAWDVKDLDPSFARPAEVQAQARLAAARLADAGQQVKLADARATVSANVRGPDAFDARIDLPVGKLDVRSDGVSLALSGASLGVRAQGVKLHAEDPMRSRGRITVSSSLPRLTARTPEVRARVEDLGLSVEAELPGGGPIALTGSLPLGRVDVRDTGSGDRLVGLRDGTVSWRVDDVVLHPTDPLRTRAKVHLEGALPRISLADEGQTLAVPSFVLDATAHGARKAYDAKLRLALRSTVQRGARVQRTDLRTTLDAHADLRKPGVRVALGVRGPKGPEIDARLDAGFTAAQRSLDYELGLEAARLDLLGELLPAEVREAHQVDWKALRVSVAGKGAVQNVIQRIQGGTTPVLAEDPVAALRGEQTLSVDIEGLDYRSPEQSVVAPRLTLRFDGARRDDAAHAELDLRVPSLAMHSGAQEIEVTGLGHRLDITSPGPPEQSRVTLAMTTDIDRVDQNIIGYPVEKAHMEVRGHLDRLSSLRIDQMRFDNPAGGTSFEAKVAMDQPPPALVADTAAIPGRQALTMSGTLRQDLARISLGAEGPRMRGRMELPFSVESGDLSAFLVALRARLDDVHVALPDAAVQGFDGEIPVLVEVALLPDGGVRLIDGPPDNLYSRTRFLDVHPFLRGQHYLSIEKVSYLGTSVGPIAGNLRVERDSLALDQLQMGLLGGNISGQLAVDYRNGKPRMMFRGNVTGIRPSADSDDVLDANAALTMSMDPLGVEGRVQVVRMGRGHLMAMLDVIDPYHQDVAVNRVRLGLQVGYPEFLRLRMKDGFLAAKIDLGGVAGAVRIDEIRGIALGPLLNMYVAPYLPTGAKP